jgi:hypothetical protein
MGTTVLQQMLFEQPTDTQFKADRMEAVEKNVQSLGWS